MTQEAASQGEPAPFDPVEDAIAAVGRGELVVVVDAESRENEGDLVVAGSLATPELINFMTRHGRGLICAAMDGRSVGRLGIGRMQRSKSRDRFHTAWMESVDAHERTTTGISAADRAATIRRLADPSSTAADFVRPGHVFPLEARARGVLERAGHTEAAVDLCKLAGSAPCGVICEILREDGEMARLPDLAAFKQVHGLKMISIADLAHYRQSRESSVRLEREVAMPLRYGLFTCRMYHHEPEAKHHLALVHGDPASQDAPLVRVHSECFTGDLLGSLRCDCGGQLDQALQLIVDEGHGILIYLRQEGRGIGLAHKLHAYALQDEGYDTVEANQELGFEADLRDYGVAVQILRDLGVTSVRLLTNNPDKVGNLESYGIGVAERVPLVVEATPHNARYLETKKTKMGHVL